ncbi:MAG: acyl-CoA thioesterase [Deltaproteobacteria bacterium]|nr:acyl-CoA thioesterase [Deltaproteobacteria bacterium]
MRLTFDPAACRFATEVRVRWADTDAGGIAYNGAYLTWLEVARVEYFRTLVAFSRGLHLGHPLVQDQLLEAYPLSFALASCAVDWRKPVRVDARLRVWIGMSRIGRRSLDQQYVFERAADGEQVAYAETTTVQIDAATLAPVDLPESMRVEIETFEAALLKEGGPTLVQRLETWNDRAPNR